VEHSEENIKYSSVAENKIPPQNPKSAQHTKGADEADNKLIRQYKRQKSGIRWCLYLLIPCVLAFFILKFFSETSTTVVEENGRLGGHVYFNNDVCLLTVTRGGKQEVLKSSDSARSFRRTRFSWPVRDSNVILSYLPKTNTILALEHRGLLRVIQPQQNRYDSSDLNVFVNDSALGIAHRPSDDSLFIYGKFPLLIPIYIRNDSIQLKKFDLFNNSRLGIQSLAFDEKGTAGAVVSTSSYTGTLMTTTDFLEWVSLYGSPIEDTIRNKQTSIVREPRVVEQSQRDDNYYRVQSLLSVAFDEQTRQLYYTSRPAFGNRIIQLALMSEPRKNLLQGVSLTMQQHKAILDHQGDAIAYGFGPTISKANGSDSIPYASEVLVPSPNGQQALIRNPAGNYLVSKNINSGQWDINPIVITKTRFTNLTPIFLVIIGLLVLGLAFFFLTAAASKREILKAIKKQNDENALVPKSERPLGTEDEDLLGFEGLEEAVHLILQNPKLEMPMTIVVSGTWGSGKTSMMNRIKEKLEYDPQINNQFLTTWFNAWHLQGETSLLNAFLMNIINSYERYYAFLSPFRVKIAASRFHRLPFWKKFGFGFAMAVLLPLILALVFSLFPVSWHANIPALEAHLAALKTIFLSFPFELSKAIVNPVVAGILVIISLLFFNRQFVPTGLSAFIQLLPRNNFTLDVEKQETGTREKFRQQYWEIMNAVRKGKKLVVFIDDLDRIGGDKILELLEGINFISDIASRPPGAELRAPNTIFVLGMYTEEVARLVGSRLKEINGSTEEALTLGSYYIEKMVQLVVPVPFDTENNEKLKKLYENI
jgi:Cdc6-like AAA superfamily ATPase